MCLILTRNGDKMNVKQLIEALSVLNPELPVHVMNDNGCRDPGYDEATHVTFQFNTWHKKEIVYIDSDY